MIPSLTWVVLPQVDMTELPDGTLLLAYNDESTKRTPLCLAASRDAGATWSTVAVLEDDPKGSFSYPTLQYLPAEVSTPRCAAVQASRSKHVSSSVVREWPGDSAASRDALRFAVFPGAAD